MNDLDKGTGSGIYIFVKRINEHLIENLFFMVNESDHAVSIFSVSPPSLLNLFISPTHPTTLIKFRFVRQIIYNLLIA